MATNAPTGLPPPPSAPTGLPAEPGVSTGPPMPATGMQGGYTGAPQGLPPPPESTGPPVPSPPARGIPRPSSGFTPAGVPPLNIAQSTPTSNRSSNRVIISPDFSNTDGRENSDLGLLRRDSKDSQASSKSAGSAASKSSQDEEEDSDGSSLGYTPSLDASLGESRRASFSSQQAASQEWSKPKGAERIGNIRSAKRGSALDQNIDDAISKKFDTGVKFAPNGKRLLKNKIFGKEFGEEYEEKPVDKLKREVREERKRMQEHKNLAFQWAAGVGEEEKRKSPDGRTLSKEEFINAGFIDPKYWDAAIVVGGESEFSLRIGAKDAEMMKKDMMQSDSEKFWAWFDTLSGLVVILNGILIGYDVTMTDEEKEDRQVEFFYYENAFLFVFTAELSARIKRGGGFGVLKNPWNAFDAIVILISAVDNWILQTLLPGGGAGFVSVFRIMRLFRLLRLVRLVVLSPELMLLVQGIVHSFRLLIWTLFTLALAIYTCSVCILDMDELNDLTDLKVLLPWRFGTFDRTMFTLFRFALFDEWGDVVRVMLYGDCVFQVDCEDGDDNMRGNWMYWPLIMLFLAISSIGLMNLLVGVMVTKAMSNAKDEKKLDRNKAIANSFFAMERFRTKVDAELERLHKGKINKKKKEKRLKHRHNINEELLVKWRRQWPFRQFFDVAKLTERDLKMVFDEISSAAATVDVDIDDFVEGCGWIRRSVSALDVLTIDAGLRVTLKNLMATKSKLDNTLIETVDANEYLEGMLFEVQTATKKKAPVAGRKYDIHAAAHEASKFASHGEQLSEEDEEIIMERKRKRSQEACWGRFDAFFGIFVIANGITIGMETMPGINSASFTFIDQIFLLIFVVEFVLRAVLYYQLHHCYIFDMMMWVFPQLEGVQPMRVLAKGIDFLNPRRDAWVCFDLFLVISSFINVIIIPALSDGGGNEGRIVGIVRVFRIFRLMRLARILRLFRSLQLLVDGMMASVRILLWSIMFLMMITFVGSIVGLEILCNEEDAPADGSRVCSYEEDPEIYQYFGSLARGMMTLTQVATFENWGDVLALFREKRGGVAVSIFFMSSLAFAGLAAMSLVVGVMVESAFRLAKEEKDRRSRDAIGGFREELRKELASIMREHKPKKSFGGTIHNLFRSFSGTLSKTGSAAKNAVVTGVDAVKHAVEAKTNAAEPGSPGSPKEEKKEEEKGHKFRDDDLSDQWIPLERLAEYSTNISPTLHDALKKANLEWNQVWSTASRLDIYGTGKIRLNELIETLTRSSCAVYGLDIAAARNGFRRLCNKGRALKTQVEEVGKALGIVANKLGCATHPKNKGKRVRELQEEVRQYLVRLGFDDQSEHFQEQCANPRDAVRTMKSAANLGGLQATTNRRASMGRASVGFSPVRKTVLQRQTSTYSDFGNMGRAGNADEDDEDELTYVIGKGFVHVTPHNDGPLSPEYVVAGHETANV